MIPGLSLFKQVLKGSHEEDQKGVRVRKKVRGGGAWATFEEVARLNCPDLWRR